MRAARQRRRRLRLFLAVMGPGIITASVDQDAGGITTYTLAGAQYGYKLLWSLLFIGLALAVVQEMGTRMGVVSGKGVAELVREGFGGGKPRLRLFDVTPFLAVPLAAALVSLLVVRGTYAAVERIFLAASIFY